MYFNMKNSIEQNEYDVRMEQKIDGLYVDFKDYKEKHILDHMAIKDSIDGVNQNIQTISLKIDPIIKMMEAATSFQSVMIWLLKTILLVAGAITAMWALFKLLVNGVIK